MGDHDISKYIESVIIISYLVFIFLSIQIWLLWRDTDEKKLKLNVDKSFLNRNGIYVFLFSLFLMIHEFLVFKLFKMLAFIVLVLFAHEWYCLLKTCAHKKSLLRELADIQKQ